MRPLPTSAFVPICVLRAVASRQFGQPVSFAIVRSYFRSAASSHPSSSKLVRLKAASAALMWQAMIAWSSLLTCLPTASSHFPVALSGATKPASSPPSGVVPAQATRPLATSVACSLAIATAAAESCVMHGGQMFLASSLLAARTKAAPHACSHGSSSNGAPLKNAALAALKVQRSRQAASFLRIFATVSSHPATRLLGGTKPPSSPPSGCPVRAAPAASINASRSARPRVPPLGISVSPPPVRLPAFREIREPEQVIGNALVVPHVAHVEDCVRSGRHIGHHGLDQRGVILDPLVAPNEDALHHLLAAGAVHVEPPEKVVAPGEPEPIARVRELFVPRHQLDHVARLPVEVLLTRDRGRRLRIIPLLDAHQELQVTVGEVAPEEVLVLLCLRQPARPPRRGRPDPLIVPSTPRGKMEKERPLHVGGSGELCERSLAPARVGLLADVELSGAREGVLVVVLQRGRRGAVAPGGEAVALLRGVDHLAPGDGERRESAEQGEKRERSGHRSSSWQRQTLGRAGLLTS